MRTSTPSRNTKYRRAIIAMLTTVIMVCSAFSVYAIPTKDTVVQPSKSKTHYAFYGIDVSVWQSNVDWDSVKRAGADYAFMRAGATRSGTFTFIEDDQFEKNMENAKEAGVARGIYWYSQATTVEEAKAEAEELVKLAEGKNPELPLVMDMEFSGGRFDEAYSSWKSEGGSEYASQQLTEIAEAFLGVCRENGYTAALYVSQSLADSAAGLDTERLVDQGYEMWIAQYNETNTSSTDYTYWQYGSIDNIGGISGRIDSDYMYVPKSPINNDGINASLNSKKVTYTGNPVRPEVTVTDGTEILKENEDYTLVYTQNIDKGTGYVVIKGKGDYEGYTECLSYEIAEKAVANTSDGQPVDVVTNEVDGNTSVKFNAAEGKVDDYQIAYRNSSDEEWQYVTTGGRTEYVIEGTPSQIKVSAVQNNEVIGSQKPNNTKKAQIVDSTVQSDVGLSDRKSVKKSSIKAINQEVIQDVSLGAE